MIVVNATNNPIYTKAKMDKSLNLPLDNTPRVLCLESPSCMNNNRLINNTIWKSWLFKKCFMFLSFARTMFFNNKILFAHSLCNNQLSSFVLTFFIWEMAEKRRKLPQSCWFELYSRFCLDQVALWMSLHNFFTKTSRNTLNGFKTL